MDLACTANVVASKTDLPNGPTRLATSGMLTLEFQNFTRDQVTSYNGSGAKERVLRKGLHELTKATGRQFQRGLLHPTADLVA